MLTTNQPKRTLVLICFTSVMMLHGCDSESPSGNTPLSPTYQPGQVWTYDHRESEDASHLVILQIDKDPKLGTIVHVSIDGVSLRNPQVTGGVTHQIGHLPFSKDAKDRSVRDLVSSRPLPDFQEGYSAWREAYENSQGGIFTITVGEAVESMEQVLNQAP